MGTDTFAGMMVGVRIVVVVVVVVVAVAIVVVAIVVVAIVVAVASRTECSGCNIDQGDQCKHKNCRNSSETQTLLHRVR